LRWRQLLVLLGLTGLAISQPLLSLMGQNPTVLAFYGVDGRWLVLYAVGLVVLPPAILWSVGLGLTVLDDRVGIVFHLAVVATLLTLTATQALKSLGLESTPAVAVLALILSAGVTLAYARYPAVETWLEFTSVLPFAALALFVLTSPAGDLVGGRPSVGEAGSGVDHPPVVLVVLDELPTRSLLDADDNIDEVRFPHLAEFAGSATWYRHYTTVAPLTVEAVPSLLTGNQPERVRPRFERYPDNLFTGLAPTHDLVAYESATKLCGLQTCTTGAPGTTQSNAVRLADLVGLTADLFRERVSPAPNRGARLDTFEEEVVGVSTPASAGPATTEALDALNTDSVVNRPQRLADFEETLVLRDGRPALFYLHLLLPHSPWRFMPDGQAYDAPSRLDERYPFDLSGDQGAWVQALAQQRHLLQAQYADRLLGQLMTRLKEQDLFDESLVVVVADHGISFQEGTATRILGDDSTDGLGGIAYAPLLIKAPGQTNGTIDDTNITSLDLSPTIAQLVGVDLPYETEGRAVGDPEREARGPDRIYHDLVEVEGFGLPTTRQVITFDGDEFFPHASERWIGPIGPADDPMLGLYRRFGLEDLLGASIADLAVTNREVSVDGGAYAAPSDGRPPRALLSGVVEDGADGDVVIAVVDGNVVAASPLTRFKEREDFFSLLVPPDVLLADEGDATVDLLVVEHER
jgi:hypothetical protein